VLRRNVHRHVVVQDLDGQVLPRLAANLALLALYDRPCSVVRVHHLVADLVQADSLSRRFRRSAGAFLGPPARISEPTRVGEKTPVFQGFSRKIPAQTALSPSAAASARRSESATSVAPSVPAGARTAVSPSLRHSSSRRGP